MNFEASVKEQMLLLRDTARNYDESTPAHAKSIATRISTLMEILQSKDGAAFVKNEKSLLISDWFPALPQAKTHGHHPLVTLSVETVIGSGRTEARFSAHIDKLASPDQRNLVSISKWQKETVLHPAKGKGVSRRYLYMTMRNKDGGAHAPSAVEPEYAGASSPHGLGLKAFGVEGSLQFDPPAHYATMRQMAHELLISPRLNTLI
jgi:hypothetical protein